MTQRPSYRIQSVLAFALILAHGCSVDAGPEGEPLSSDEETTAPLSLDELELVAEANYVGGSLRYYNVNGALLEQETGDAEHLRALLPNEAGLSAADKYTALTGKPAPQQLVALTAAHHETDGELDAEDYDDLPHTDSAAPVDKDLGMEGGALDFQNFYARYCQPTDDYWERVLWPMPTRRKQGKSRYYRFGVHAFAGPVRWKFLFNGLWISDSLAADHFVAFRLTNGWPGADSESKAEQDGADGGLITHCVNSHD